ncbi:MAG TPA: hypothetical protein PLD46_09895 [Hyphomicrobium sp.]|nr:hypothetical protein [Hyphomicrobium sp.]
MKNFSRIECSSLQHAARRAPLSDIDRRAELQRLLPLWPSEANDLSLAGRRHIIHTIERALRGERRRGRAGHWAYNLSRHMALAQTWRLECAALKDAERALPNAPTKKRAENGARLRS